MSLLDNLKNISPRDIELKSEPEKEERFIIITSKELTKEDKDVFECYGKLTIWDNRFVNLKYEDIEFDYLVVDIRDKTARYNLASQNIEKFNVVMFVSWYEKIEEWIEQIIKKTNDSANVLTSIPDKCINKEHFNRSLLVEKLTSPSFFKSVAKYVARCLGK